MVVKNLKLLTLLIFICSCSSLQQRNASNEVVKLYSNGEYQELVKKINEKKLYQREQDRFLKQAELGTLFFRLGEYEQALASFRLASQISEELYTIRVSKKLKSFLMNDSDDIYYPNPYELSMIRFYEIMASIMLEQKSNQTKHRRMLEPASRSWQAYLDNLKERKLGEADFKGVVLADVMSYIVHLYLGSSADKSIAKSFRNIARKNLKQKMGLYESFNSKYEAYREDFSKLHLKSEKELFKKYISKTEVYKGVESFLKKNYSQVIVLLNGNITPKKPKKYSFPIDFIGYAASHNLSGGDFASFSARVLALSSGTKPTIAFELPTIDSSSKRVNSPFKILKEGQEIFKGKATTVSHNSEVMKKLLDEEATKARIRLGTKLVAKHLAILASAYGTYRVLKKKQGEFLAYVAATAAYAVSNKALEALELADIRSWNGLHDFIEVVPLKLKKGSYIFEYGGKKLSFNVTGKKKQIIPLIL